MEQNIKKMFSEFASQIESDLDLKSLSDLDIINKWITKLMAVRNEYKHDYTKLPFNELYNETLLAITKKKETNLEKSIYPTGLVALDKIIGGFSLGELTVLGARPAMGKSSFLNYLICHSIKSKKGGIALFSLESSQTHLMLRLMHSSAELAYGKLANQKLEDYEINQLIEKTKLFKEANIIIEDNCFTIDDIIAQTDYLVKEKGVIFIMIDYLQLIQVRGKMNREQEVARACRELKTIARKHNIAVLVSSQLSRALESRGGDKRPQLSDLRESGAIEQIADKVLFLHRPAYYNITEDEYGRDTYGVAEIIIAKNRIGAVDIAKIRFISEFSTFADCEYNDDSVDFISTFKDIRIDEFGQFKKEDHPF